MLKKEVHVFKGMNRDNNPMNIDTTLAFEIRNMRITVDKTNNSLLSLVNEKGPENTGLSIAGTYLGHAVLNDYLIIFSTSTFDNTKYDHIQVFEVTSSIEYKGDLLHYVDVGFNVNNPIETIALYENNALQKVYFTDGLNQPRVINIIATKDYKIKYSSTQIKKGELAIGFINSDNSTLLNFSTTISLNHKIAITKLHNGGVFPTGVIQYCFSYYNLGMQETSLFEVTPMYYLSQIDHGDDTTELQSCAFRINLTNLDSSYQYVRCYSIIKTSKTSVTSCRIVGDYNIVNNEVNITDTGDIGSTIDATKLLFVGSKVFTAYTMTSKDNTLFLGNLSYKNTKYKINYNDFHFDQCLLDYYGKKQYDVSWYGSQIVTKQSTNVNDYNPNVRNEYYLYNNDSVNIANDRNSRAVKRFKTNEYYKFGIVLQFSDGSFSDAISLNIKQIGDGGITPIFLKSNNKPLEQISAEDYKNNNVDSCFLTPSYRVLLNDNFIDWCNGKDVSGYEKLNNEKVLRIYPICAYPTEQYRSCITQGFLSPTVFNISKRYSNSVYAQSSWIYRYYNNYSDDGIVPNAYHLGSLYFNNKKHCEILNTGTLTDYNKKYNFVKKGLFSFVMKTTDGIQNHKEWYYAPVVYKTRLKDYIDTISNYYSNDTLFKIPSRLPYFTESCVDDYSDMFFQDCSTLTFNSPETELGLLNNVDFENVNLRIVGFSNFATSNARIKDNVTLNTDNLLIKNFIYNSCDFNGTNRDLDNTNTAYGSGYGKQLDKSKECKFSSVPLFKFMSHDDKAFAHYIFNGDHVAAIATDKNGKNIYYEYFSSNDGANTDGKILNTFYEKYDSNSYYKYGSLAFGDLTINQSIKGQVHYGFTDYFNVAPSTLPIIDKPKLYNYNTEQATSIFTTYDTLNKMYYGNIKQQGLYNPTYKKVKFHYKNDEGIYTYENTYRQPILHRGNVDSNDLEYDEAIFLPDTVAVKYPIVVKYKSTPHIVLSLGDVNNKHICLSQRNNTVDYKTTDVIKSDIKDYKFDEKYANNISIDNVDYGLFKNSSYLNSKDDNEDNPYIAGLFIGELFRNPGDIGIKQTYKFRNGVAVEGDYMLRDEHNNYISATNEDVCGYPYYVGKNNGYQLDRIIDDECTYMGGKSNEPYIKWCICGEPITLTNDKSDINEFNGIDWVTTKKYELIYQEGDCYIGRFDSMKTYPFEELGDGIVEIYSSELESRVNLDERVDYFNRKNYLQGLRITQVRPYGYGTETSNVAFNTFNDDAYNQENNYFVFTTFDENTITANRFPNQITWSLEKTIGETIDTWSNIQLTSLLDLDGSKGDIEYLTKYNDTIFSFQYKGISQILFNSRVQIPTSDNNPIEITNGYKVDGKRYISETIGSQNKHSIVVGDTGIYFIDNLRSSAYLFGSNGLVSLSSNNGMQTYFNSINSLYKWKPLQYTTKCFYDTKRNEIYYTGDKESLVYNELTQTFTSFFDYDNLMLFENINDKTVTLYRNTIYKMFEGKYNNFFLNNYKPFYIKFYSNFSNLPQHKTFNNIEWQTNYFTDVIQPSLTWTDVTIENPYQSTTQHLMLTGNSRLDTMEKRFDIFRTYFKRTTDNRNRLERIAYPYALIGLHHNLSNKDKSFRLEHFNTTVSIQL